MKTIKRLLTRIILSVCLFPAVVADEPGKPSNWSSFAGDGDFVPDQQGLTLIENPANIRVFWKNPTHTGIGKGGGGSTLDALEKGFEPAYGELSNLIVADGILFCSWSQPSGDVFVEPSSFKHRYWDDDEKEALKDTYLRVDADWKTIAIDAKTGETLWEANEKKATIHFYSNKRGHLGLSGAYGNGVYVTMSIMGEIFAYDAKTGQRRWQAKIDDWYQRASEYKAAQVKAKNLPKVGRGPWGSNRRGCAIVGDVVVVPGNGANIVGFRLSDGKKLWEVKKGLESYATPQVWRHDGKTWLLCNGVQGHDRDASQVLLVDPANGEVAWRHESGANRGSLVFGEKHLILNVRGEPKKGDDWDDSEGLYACYEISPTGLKEIWRFEDQPENIYKFNPDHGAMRNAAIRDGVLYIGLGAVKKKVHVQAVDIKTGQRLQRSENRLPGFASQPIIAEEKIFWQTDAAHSSSFAGFRVYQIKGDGQFENLGEMRLKYAGITYVGGYETPTETPYYDGRLYVRGRYGIYALNVRQGTKPMAQLRMNDLWAGSTAPVEARMFGDSEGVVQSAKLEIPRASQLGIIFSKGYRRDGWGVLKPHGKLMIGQTKKTKATLNFGAFSWEADLEFKREGDAWRGTWTRTIPEWAQKQTTKGGFHDGAKAGYDARIYMTPWYKNQPITTMGELPKGQRRMQFYLPGFLPSYKDVENGRGPDAHKGFTMCLDYDGEKFVGGVCGAFGFNQAWHEIDTSGLKLTDNGFSGKALVIVNPDPWWAPNVEKGTAIVGEVTFDAKFGEPDKEGLREITGSWQTEWGRGLERSGSIETKLKNVKNKHENAKSFIYRSDSYSVLSDANRRPARAGWKTRFEREKRDTPFSALDGGRGGYLSGSD